MKLFFISIIFRTDFQRLHPGYTIQPQTVKPPFWEKVESEISPSGLGADKNLQGKPCNLSAVSGTGAVVLKGNALMLPNGREDIQKNLILQGMYEKIVLPGKEIVVFMLVF